MMTPQNIDLLYFTIINALISSAMTSYVETSFASSEDPAILIYSQTDVDKVKFSPEEAKIDKEIDAVQKRTCLILIGDCWLYLKKKKSEYSEEHRFNVCMKKILGFQICRSIPEGVIDKAITATEEKVERDKREKDYRALEAEYREGRLFYLKAKWITMRHKAAEYLTGTSSTTKKPGVESSSSSEES